MLAHQWNELLGGNKKRNRINETQQSQNNPPRQPIGISACEKFVEDVFVIHETNANPAAPSTFNGQHPTFNTQRSISQPIHDPKSKIDVPGGRIELPTKGL